MENLKLIIESIVRHLSACNEATPEEIRERNRLNALRRLERIRQDPAAYAEFLKRKRENAKAVRERNNRRANEDPEFAEQLKQKRKAEYDRAMDAIKSDPERYAKWKEHERTRVAGRRKENPEEYKEMVRKLAATRKVRRANDEEYRQHIAEQNRKYRKEDRDRMESDPEYAEQVMSKRRAYGEKRKELEREYKDTKPGYAKHAGDDAIAKTGENPRDRPTDYERMQEGIAAIVESIAKNMKHVN